MKKDMHPKLTGSARILSLIGLIGISFLLSVHAMPPPSAFGVWDRGSSFDPKDHPFLKGLAFNEKWADVEKQPGVFDWSTLDEAMDAAVRKNQFICNSSPQKACIDHRGSTFSLQLPDASKFVGLNVQIAHITLGKHGNCHRMAAAGIQRQRACTIKFDVIRMSANGQNLHFFFSHCFCGNPS